MLLTLNIRCFALHCFILPFSVIPVRSFTFKEAKVSQSGVFEVKGIHKTAEEDIKKKTTVSRGYMIPCSDLHRYVFW